jgi:hypothetical protein
VAMAEDLALTVACPVESLLAAAGSQAMGWLPRLVPRTPNPGALAAMTDPASIPPVATSRRTAAPSILAVD